jgi:hypothetical protein
LLLDTFLGNEDDSGSGFMAISIVFLAFSASSAASSSLGWP